MEPVKITVAEHDLYALAVAQLCVFTRVQALEAGCREGLIDRRLATGFWVRLHRCVYIRADAPRLPGQDVLAAVLACGAPAAASHRTAACVWGLEGVTSPRRPQVLTVAPRHLCVPGVVVRRSRTLRRPDIVVVGAVPTTSIPRTLIDLAGELDGDHLEDALDDAIRRGAVRAESLLRRLEKGRTRGVPGVGTLRDLLLVRVGRRVGESRPENALRRLLVKRGLGEPEVQYVVRDGRRRVVARVDLAYPDARIAIEYDGYRYHTGRKRYSRDSWRRVDLEEAGWVVRCFTSSDLDERPDRVVAMLERLLTDRRR